MHPVLEVIQNSVQGTEFDGELYLVGGAVRDHILQKPFSDDLDIVTSHDAIKLAHLLHKQGVSTYYPVVFERFRTAMVHIGELQVELVTARKESYSRKSRKPNVRPGTLIDDAQRRDFTFNTLLYSLSTKEITDPLGTGLTDLKSGIVRTPLDPVKTFADDPLRMFRAVRFKWRLGFQYAEGLSEAILSQSDRLKIVSQERIRDEFMKILVHPSGSEAINELAELGLFKFISPELEKGKGMMQGDYHHLDVWDHSRLVLKNANTSDPILALAALFHDVGKPETKQIIEGRVRFFSHEAVGAAMTKRILTRLKFPNETVNQVAQLVKNHMRIGSAPEFSSSAARRLTLDLGDQLDRLLDLVEADASSLARKVRKLDLEPIRKKISEVKVAAPASSLQSPLTGDEIMELLEIPMGPRVGEIKEKLKEAVLEGRLSPNDKLAAIELLKAES